MRILFTGGGTGGHIFPIIAVKREIDKIINNLEQYSPDIPKELLDGHYQFIGGDVATKRDILERESIKTKEILSPKWRRYFSFKNFIDILKAPCAFFQACFLVWIFMPDAILSKGGPGSFFIVLVGWLYRIPIIVHESDSVPGLTNKWSFPFAKKIAISFKTSVPPKKKVIVTGHPVRQLLIKGSRERAKEQLKLSDERKVILVMGGSQGAQEVNLVLIDAIYRYIEKYEIIHICGQGNFKDLNLLMKGLLKEEQKKFYHLFPNMTEDELKDAYAASDLIISRSGAGSIFEIAAVEKPSILIPLKISANDHQVLNAQIFQNQGCGVVIENENVSPNVVFSTARDILEDEETLNKYIKGCNKFAKPNAAQKIAQVIMEEI
jgi:UDP-N-acetylglucosamine--N-acetylmuramyl-(pentapeptide) pyrophosphoryl-undecaprenol N-acetylglucosamine transferase